MKSLRIGLIINPIAGIGSEFAWKGTDDIKRAWKMIDNGYINPIWKIVNRALLSISPKQPIEWLLGASYPNISGEVVYEPEYPSDAEDSKKAAFLLQSHDIDLLLFAGGDGTANDIGSVLTSVPMIGIPAGVKIFSPCFLHRPEDLGNFLLLWNGDTIKTELFDIDEENYRLGRLLPKLSGTCLIPVSQHIQEGKLSYTSDDEETFELIAKRIQEEGLLNGKRIILGSGGTMQRIGKYLNLDLSLLGLDVVENGIIIVKDATTEDLTKYTYDEIWLSPIGQQGHIFGRGNRQLRPENIRKVKRIRIFGTPEKIRQTSYLYVDTGDPELDNSLKGYYSVIVGYYEEIMRKAV